MFKKIGKFSRKLHRFVTPLFIVFTVINMFIFQHPAINMLQRVTMLTMAASGSYLFAQIYYIKYKVSKKRNKVAV